jgi:hypothetical protein
LLVTQGSLLSLAGVYTISFLGVMTLFGIGNILLKIRRRELKRTYRAGWMTILVAITATSLGMMGNVIIDYKNLLYFMHYFIPTVFLVVLMYMRIPILRTILQLLNNLMTRILLWRTTIIDHITSIIEQKVILFARGGNLGRLNTAFNYIMHNESSRSVIVFHLYNQPEYNKEKYLAESLKTLHEIFPLLKTQLVAREGKFGAEIINSVSKEFGVPVNNIFIGAPEEKHSFSIQDLGGVRVIF